MIPSLPVFSTIPLPLTSSTNDDISVNDKPDNQIKLFYYNPNVFILSSQYVHSGEVIKAFWIREGLFKWKLNSIDICECSVKMFDKPNYV